MLIKRDVVCHARSALDSRRLTRLAERLSRYDDVAGSYHYPYRRRSHEKVKIATYTLII